MSFATVVVTFTIYHFPSKKHLPSHIFHLPSSIEEASSIEESVLKYVITS